ncbi:non-canonical purine NTP pyrophosphatase [Patescibacteria group bacterium]|nr:non-canonical purine NTP pyrophosphatase [Patescibacteria group bacterium]
MLTLVTSNKNKTLEYERYLGVPIANEPLDLPEIQSLSHEEVIEAKVRDAYARIGSPVLVDDSGLLIDGMNGLPGPLTKWFEIALGIEGVCRLADTYPDRKGSVTAVVGFFDGTEFRYFRGDSKGTIADHPRGDNGFGFDVAFIHEGDTRTRAELTTEERDARPFRKTALEALKTYLQGRGIL